MKTRLIVVLAVIATWHCCVAPPVTKNKDEKEGEDGDGLELMMHYHRYLKQVVGALESDPDFKKKLESADEADIRSGKIANELEFVSHHVRTRLDELKRTELDRLRHLMKEKMQLSENTVEDDPNHHGHIDHSNPHTFEIEDLKKLIEKTTADLAEADRKRREEFKQYELQKEFDKQDKLNHTNGKEREELEHKYQEMEAKHKKHEPLHQPGHKAQLEEVWEEQDHMQQEFDPKTFFMLHDLDSNGLWDQDEVKALFIKELDKMYQAGAPEDDMRERVEEMERMRETVFQEVDLNRDGFIDFHEFLSQTQRQNFQQDNGWRGIDEQRPYTDEELQAYIRQQQMMHPPPGYHMPPPGHPMAPGQYPPGHGPPPPGAYHPNQVPQGAYQGHPNQVPPGYQQHPNQVHQGGYQGQQFNQGYQQHPQAQFQQAQQGMQQGNPPKPPLNTNEVYQNQVPQQQPPVGQANQGQANYQAQPNQGQQVNQGQPINQQQQQVNQGQAQQNYQTNQAQAQPNYQVNQGQANQQQQQQQQPQQQQQQQQQQQPQQQQQQQQPQQQQQQQPQQQQQQQQQPQQQQQQQPNVGQQNYQVNEPQGQGQPQVQQL